MENEGEAQVWARNGEGPGRPAGTLAGSVHAGALAPGRPYWPANFLLTAS
jgi:hypothetical protein